VLEWLVFGVWMAPQPDLMYADCSYCDSGCVCSGGKGMLVVVVGAEKKMIKTAKGSVVRFYKTRLNSSVRSNQ
jgi:hypothetical protein